METHNIEFKSNWRNEYLKVISAFANMDGGILFIGLDDKGNPVGVESAQKLYANSIKKLKTGPGNLISKVENLKKMGVQSKSGKKSLPASFEDYDSEN